MNLRAASLALVLLFAVAGVSAQSDGFDPETIALTFHKVSGTPLDTMEKRLNPACWSWDDEEAPPVDEPSDHDSSR